jgi:hypothetical protein
VKPVDWVALALAVALGLTLALIMVVVLVNVIDHQTPTQVLGENATQIITAGIGGVIGVLGSYVGSSFRRRRTEP